MDEINTQPRQAEPDAVDQTDSAAEVASGAESPDAGPALDTTVDLMAVVSRDIRVAHFLVDVLGGKDVDEALAGNFPPPRAEPDPGAIAEAEQRGYLRGLNEKAEASLAEPGPYEEVHPPRPNHPHSASPLVESAARPSIWDIF